MAADPPFHPDTNLLDQHFLKPAIARTLVARAGIDHDDVVLDLGAGTGALTAEILRRRPHRTIAIETDARCEPALTVLADRSDALELRFSRIQDLRPAELSGVTLIVANPPFSTLEHLARLMRELPSLKSAHLCVSLSWARSAVADPSSDRYSLTSLSIQSRFDTNLVQLIAGSSFTPPITRPAAWLQLTHVPTIDPLLDLLADLTLRKAGTRLKDVFRSPRVSRSTSSQSRIRALQADAWIKTMQQRRLAALTADQVAHLVRAITTNG